MIGVMESEKTLECGGPLLAGMDRIRVSARPGGRAATKALAAGLALAAVFTIYMAVFRTSVVRTWEGPSSRYAVEVRRSPLLFESEKSAHLAQGQVRLVDRSSGKVLEKQYVAMVGLVEEVRWGRNTVTLPFVAEWRLPPAR